MKTIKELERNGYSFWLSDENIQFEYRGTGGPDPAIVKPLLVELKARKAEALRYLRSRQHDKVVDFDGEVAKIKAALKTRGIAKIYSRTLDDVVYWARDDREATKVPKGAVVYTLDELRHLVDIKANSDALNQIHQAKKIFGGKLMDKVQDPFASGDDG